MRDEEDNVLHNAHILGVFRRICKVRPGHVGRASLERLCRLGPSRTLRLLCSTCIDVPASPPLSQLTAAVLPNQARIYI